jgi:UvrB/uvrC motif
MKRKSRFLDIFKKNRKKANTHQEMIVVYTKKLQEALGIDDHTLEEMVYDDHSMEYGEYLLVCNSRCFHSGWENVIEVVPKNLGARHGYSNTSYMANGDNGWHYVMNGTGTECLPPKEVRYKLLALIKLDNEKYLEDSPVKEKILTLEAEKDLAVEEENFEEAQRLRDEIKELREQQS